MLFSLLDTVRTYYFGRSFIGENILFIPIFLYKHPFNFRLFQNNFTLALKFVKFAKFVVC
ncbi:hypothetical protein HMPREF1870_01103 [Bacteroidales bacterium KA00344]|nr:hypothetical protein HMPREF1870_01103 [Bacteroidales bacterium KA00344]